MKQKIASISFWRRDPNAVNKFDEVLFDCSNKKLDIKNGSEARVQSLSDDKATSLKKELTSLIDKSKLDEEYFAHRYEDDKTDFNIKFFLTVHYFDKTYFAYKGLYPFKEAGYQEIVSFFDKIIKNQDESNIETN